MKSPPIVLISLWVVSVQPASTYGHNYIPYTTEINQNKIVLDCYRNLSLGTVTYQIPCPYLSDLSTREPPYLVNLTYPAFLACTECVGKSVNSFDPFSLQQHSILHLRIHGNLSYVSNQIRYNRLTALPNSHAVKSYTSGLVGYEVGPVESMSRFFLSASTHSLITCSFENGMELCDDTIESDDGVTARLFMNSDQISKINEIEAGVRSTLAAFSKGK